MANHRSAEKRHRQSLKRRARNRHYKGLLRSAVRQVREAVAAGDAETARTAFQAAQKVAGRVAGKGVIHRNRAARLVSRLAGHVRSVESA